MKSVDKLRARINDGLRLGYAQSVLRDLGFDYIRGVTGATLLEYLNKIFKDEEVGADLFTEKLRFTKDLIKVKRNDGSVGYIDEEQLQNNPYQIHKHGEEYFYVSDWDSNNPYCGCSKCCEARKRLQDGNTEVKSYSYDVTRMLPLVEVTEGVTSFGLEVEGIFDESEVDPEYVTEGLQDKITLKYDGSIDSYGEFDNSFCAEIVTRPMQYATMVDTVKKLFTKLDDNFVENDTCGIHIHVGKNSFKDLIHQQKFVSFFSNTGNYGFIEEVSGRGECDYNRFNEDSFAICDRSLRSFNSVNKVNDYHRASAATTSKGTIEVRTFGHYKDLETTLGHIDFVNSLVEFTKVCEYSELTAERFLAFVGEDANFLTDEAIEIAKDYRNPEWVNCVNSLSSYSKDRVVSKRMKTIRKKVDYNLKQLIKDNQLEGASVEMAKHALEEFLFKKERNLKSCV